MERSAKLATPRTASRMRVHGGAAPAGCSPSGRVTVPWNAVSTLPLLSFALTRTAGESGSPAVALGGAANSRRAAAGSDPPSWNSFPTSQLTSAPSARTPATRRGQEGVRNGDDDDIEGTAGHGRQTRHARLERVAHAGLVDAQIREGRDPIHEVHDLGAPEVGVFAEAAVVLDRYGHLADEAGNNVAGGVLGGDFHLEGIRQHSDLGRGLDGERQLRRRRRAGDAERRARRVVREHGHTARGGAAHAAVGRHAGERGAVTAGGGAGGGDSVVDADGGALATVEGYGIAGRQIRARGRGRCLERAGAVGDRKSTRLNSSPSQISYAVF